MAFHQGHTWWLGSQRAWSGGAKMQSLTGMAVSHRREKSSRSPLWSGEGGAHWLCPWWSFLSAVSETAVPLPAGSPRCSPRGPSATQRPLGAVQGALAPAPGSACTLSLALACFWEWDMSSLRSGSETCPRWGLGVGQIQDQAKGWWSWLTPSLD